MTARDDEFEQTGTINRRKVLQSVGTGAAIGAGLVGATGSASAHRVDKVVFCGCSQVCVCGSGHFYAHVAIENNNGYTCEKKRIPGYGQFAECYSSSEGKVIAVEDGDGEVWCNPNQSCAGGPDAGDSPGNSPNAIYECLGEGGCDDNFGESGGPCGQAFLNRECP